MEQIYEAIENIISKISIALKTGNYSEAETLKKTLLKFNVSVIYSDEGLYWGIN